MLLVRFALACRAVLLAILFAALLVPGMVAAQATPTDAPVGTVAFTGLLDHPTTLTTTDLATYDAETVEVTFLSSKGEQTHTFTGTRLWGVLEDLGLQLPDDKNGQLRLVVRLTASDGYAVVISLGEIDPTFGDAPLLLAWEQDGTPLDAPRLVVPGDVHGGRSVSDITTIEVLAVPGG